MTKYQERPDYGIDAPGLLRFFFIADIAALSFVFITLLTSLFGPILKTILGIVFFIAAVYFTGMSGLMLYFSKVEKLKESERLLNLVQWSGNEIVLDIGCGRGLMLVGAAKRLSTGKAVGIDLWQQQDQSDNSPAAALTNARIEGVTDHIEVKTADMRQLPFPKNYFDVVVSNWTVHNLEAETDRRQALSEAIRVLKPGGTVVISDIVNQVEYAPYFEQHGLMDVQLNNNPTRDAVLKAVSFGSFSPSAVSARKPLIA